MDLNGVTCNCIITFYLFINRCGLNWSLSLDMFINNINPREFTISEIIV